MQNLKKGLTPLLKILFTLGLLLWLFHRYRHEVNWREILDYWKNLQWSWLFLAAGCAAIATYIGFVRWRMLLHAQNIDLSMRDISAVGMIGVFFTSFSVGIVGGDVARTVYAVRHHPENKPAAVLSILVDRIIGLFGLCLLALVTLPLSWDVLTRAPETEMLIAVIILMVVGAITASTIVALIESPGPWQKFLTWREHLPMPHLRHKIGKSVQAYVKQWKTCLEALLISMVGHALFILCAYSGARALGFPISLEFMSGMIPIVAVATSIPITIGGFGVREGLLVMFFKSIGLSAGQAFTFSFTWFGISLLMPVIGGLVYVFYRMPGENLSVQTIDDEE